MGMTLHNNAKLVVLATAAIVSGDEPYARQLARTNAMWARRTRMIILLLW